MEFIALDNQPFSVVDVGFRRLVEHRHTLPSRSYFSDVALQELHSNNVTAISFTTDIWTSEIKPMSMLSLTAQWIVEDFVLRKVVLHAHECAGCHSAAAISIAFENMFETWNPEHTSSLHLNN